MLINQQGSRVSVMIKVNGVDMEPGLIVPAGKFADDELANIAVGLGLALTPENDPRHWRDLVSRAEEEGTGMDEFYLERLSDATDKLLETLHDVTEEGSWISQPMGYRLSAYEYDDPYEYDDE